MKPQTYQLDEVLITDLAAYVIAYNKQNHPKTSKQGTIAIALTEYLKNKSKAKAL